MNNNNPPDTACSQESVNETTYCVEETINKYYKTH